MTVAPLASSAGAVEDAACPWPPVGGRQTARKPAEGFIDCPIDVLTLPWWVYQQDAMGLSTLRVWLGTLELVEKRCGAAPGTPVYYSAEELRRLLRVPRLAPVTAAVQQLEDLGLLAWSPQAIGVLPHAAVVQEALAQDGYHTLRAQCAPGLRWVPVPRRLLRWLAQEGQPGLIATALGVLLRCMRYTARQCVAGGRVAAPWIATVFGVAERRSSGRSPRWRHAAGWRGWRCSRSASGCMGAIMFMSDPTETRIPNKPPQRGKARQSVIGCAQWLGGRQTPRSV